MQEFQFQKIAILRMVSDMQHFVIPLEKDLKMYGIQLSHTLEITSISNKKLSISIKIPSILIKSFDFN